jgi:hypothetical protein
MGLIIGWNLGTLFCGCGLVLSTPELEAAALGCLSVARAHHRKAALLKAVTPKGEEAWWNEQRKLRSLAQGMSALQQGTFLLAMLPVERYIPFLCFFTDRIGQLMAMCMVSLIKDARW